MKFSKLIDKVEKFTEKKDQGQHVKPKKLTELQELLNEKVTRYEAKLEEDLSARQREKMETRLKVVKAQLKKSNDLANSE